MIYSNVFLVYNVSIDHSKSVWNVIEQYSEGTEWNVSTHVSGGPPAILHSQVTTIGVQ